MSDTSHIPNQERMAGNCPLCRAPIKSTSGRYNTCFSGHETTVKSVLPGVLPTIPGWICWQTISNCGVSDVRYSYWGPETTAIYKQNEDEVGQELIDRYEDWMNHAYHSARIEWELDCAAPKSCIEAQLKVQHNRVIDAQSTVASLQAMLDEHYPQSTKD